MNIILFIRLWICVFEIGFCDILYSSGHNQNNFCSVDSASCKIHKHVNTFTADNILALEILLVVTDTYG